MNPALLTRQWPASWIAAPGAPERDAGVYHFRRLLTLDSVPARLLVHVSGDHRYLLHVNGQRVGVGPGRGDPEHWRFETYDLAPLLKPGGNVVAATVWNFGLAAPMAQMTRRTGFLLQADDPAFAAFNSGRNWQAQVESGHSVLADGLSALRARGFYYAAGPGERRDGRSWDWAWDTPDSPPERWVGAREVWRGHPRSISEGPAWMLSPEGWLLVPNPLPALRHEVTDAGRVARTSLEGVTAGAPLVAMTVPARSEVRVLIDRTTLTNAYPTLVVTGGRDARVRVTYAEALFDADRRKGDRNQLAGKDIVGVTDEFIADGGRSRRFEPLWFRTWRFLELHVTTADEPLTIDRVEARFTGFPLELRARFDAGDQALQRIWDISWRTVQLAAHETYVDAPYWEQLQYVGDTRVDALLSYALANDDRLARQAIEQFDDSRSAEGLTQSRYPTLEPQYIPPVLALLHRDGARLLDVSRRPRIRGGPAPRDANGARLVPRAAAAGRLARPPAVLGTRRHGHGTRRRDSGRRRRLGADHAAVSDGAARGGGARNGRWGRRGAPSGTLLPRIEQPLRSRRCGMRTRAWWPTHRRGARGATR